MSENDTHFSAVLVGRVQDGRPEVLLSYYFYINKRGRDAVCLKIPGGSGEKGESPEETACRELREETGLVAEISALQKVHTIQRSLDSGLPGLHRQHFYTTDLDQVGGEIRTGDPIAEDTPGEHLNEPHWHNLSRRLLHRDVFFKHRKGLREGILALSRMYEDFGWASAALGMATSPREEDA